MPTNYMKSDAHKVVIVFNSKRELDTAAAWLLDRYPDAVALQCNVTYKTIKRYMPEYTVVRTTRHGPLDRWDFALPIPREDYNWKTFTYQDQNRQEGGQNA